MIITIDGAAGTGKSTVAKIIAEILGFSFFDTGAMYRAFSWVLIKNKIPLHDDLKIKKKLEEFNFFIKTINNKKIYFVGTEDVTNFLRDTEVNNIVSHVAALPYVRIAIQNIQKNFANHTENSVFEGRDMGSYVFPEADIKVFLTAKPEVRAHRRLQELINQYPNEYSVKDLDKVQNSLVQRDQIDSEREFAPLCCPKNAFIIDTSNLSIDEVIDLILHYKNRNFS